MKVGVLLLTDSRSFVEKVVERTKIGTPLVIIPQMETGFVVCVATDFQCFKDAKPAADALVKSLNQDPGGQREILISARDGEPFVTRDDWIVKLEDETYQQVTFSDDIP